MRDAVTVSHRFAFAAAGVAGWLLAAPATLLAQASPISSWSFGDPIFLDGLESGACASWSATSNPLSAPDIDDDAFGDELQPTVSCSLPDGFVFDVTDCDDAEPEVHPGAAEVCSGLDDDCDELVDAADPDLVRPPCELQLGVCSGALKPAELCAGGQWGACGQAAYAAHSPSYESVEASCDGLDNDCDNQVDEMSVDTDPECAAHTFLGALAGDVNGNPANASGIDERFFRVTVSETEGSTIDLTARIDLTVAGGTDFDLFVYCLSCGGTLAGSSTQRGSGVGETIGVGRSDLTGDSTFDLLIEVRHFSSISCGLWSLTVQGNVATPNRACD
jgi:hypothetical protein